MAKREIMYHNEVYNICYEMILPQRLNKNIESSSDKSHNFVQTHDKNNTKSILFLHGWGSNKDIMKTAFSTAFSEYEHIYVDMPGFGDSSHSVPLTTNDYAAIMQCFMQNLGKNIDIAVGHSFGGKVAILCAPKEVILLSSAGIIVPKPLKIRAKIMLAKIAKKLHINALNKSFRAKDVDNMSEAMYQTFKNVVNEDFSSHFIAFNGRASIFWGESDMATPLWCGEYIARLINNSRFFVLKGEHYFFLKQGADIERLYRTS